MHNADGNKQEQGRATLIGNIEEVPGRSSRGGFRTLLRVLSGSSALLPKLTLSLTFGWHPSECATLAVLARSFWIEKDDWSVPTPEWAADESGIIQHMNDDHGDALKSMAKFFCGLDAEDVSLIAMDVEGCHIRADKSICHIPFEEWRHVEGFGTSGNDCSGETKSRVAANRPCLLSKEIEHAVSGLVARWSPQTNRNQDSTKDEYLPMSHNPFIRHTLATINYRANASISGAPESLSETRVSAEHWNAMQTLGHMNDVLSWALSIVKGAEAWNPAELTDWKATVDYFYHVPRGVR